MIVNVFCRCGCGQQTGIRDLPPGYRLKSRMHGIITGHKAPVRILDGDFIQKQRSAAFLVNTVAAFIKERHQ